MTRQLTFKTAETIAEQRQARQVIQRVFVDELNYRQMSIDQFDQIAHYLIAVQDSEVIAALRVIPDTGQGLPIEEFIDLSPLRSNEVKLAEVSRLACLSAFRNFNITCKGLAFFEETIRSLGFTHLVIESLLETVRLYRFLGFITFDEPFYDHSVDLYNQKSPNSIGLMKSMKW